MARWVRACSISAHLRAVCDEAGASLLNSRSSARCKSFSVGAVLSCWRHWLWLFAIVMVVVVLPLMLWRLLMVWLNWQYYFPMWRSAAVVLCKAWRSAAAECSLRFSLHRSAFALCTLRSHSAAI